MAYGREDFTKDLKALGINVPRGTLARLEAYAALLAKWQPRINLVGAATLPDLWRRHFLDSAQLLPLLPRPRSEEQGTLVDLGSGAGFPGLVLAIMSDWRVHLIESDQRKCAFLRQVALECGVLDRVTIHARRIEQVEAIAADVVTARACAPLDELLGLAAPFLGEAGTGLFLKGAQAEEELTRARRHWTMRVEMRGSLSDPGGKLLIITELQRKSQ